MLACLVGARNVLLRHAPGLFYKQPGKKGIKILFG